MKIGIIIGSIREGRNGEAVANWVAEGARKHGDAEFEIVDLKSFDVPLLTSPTVPAAAGRNYDSPQVTAWGEAVNAFDAFVFVTPEYNHGLPGAFKNAFDSLGPEWLGKPVAFVSYGADGGVRAVEQWRQVVANLQMLDVRGVVSLGLFTDWDDSGLAPMERRTGELDTALTQLVELTAKVR